MHRSMPNRIISNRLVIRCYSPKDVILLHDAIKQSLDHLKKWMPWAQTEPTSLAAKKELLEKFEYEFLQDLDYNFGIFNRKEDVLIGSSGLHTPVGPNSREIGYWINSKYVNQGYATESTKALIKVGFEHQEITNIRIHCDPKNLASRQIPNKLGFELVEILKDTTRGPDGKPRDTMIWNLIRNRYYEMSQNYPEIKVSRS